MKHTFELYLLTDELTPTHWSVLYKAVHTHTGLLSRFRIALVCSDNILRYYISSDKDLSSLSNSLEGILLRPVSGDAFTLPAAPGKEHFVSFVTDGNLLDLKEKYQIKQGKDLQLAIFDIRGISSAKAAVQAELYFKAAGGKYTVATKTLTTIPSKLLAVDFTSNSKYLKKSVPPYLNMEKSLQTLSSDGGNALFEVDGFPYFSRDYYLDLTSFEFDRHSFIIGASGSGKSKLISLYIDRLQRTALKMNYRVIVIDPHASLADDLAAVPDSKIIDFGNSTSAESTELFAGASADITAATELTTTLFKSLSAEGGTYNARTDKVLRFSLFVLFTAQNMSLGTLRRFLTEIDLRNSIVQHVTGYVPDNIVHFFGADFNEMRTKYYMDAISPIVSLVDEMQMQPVLVSEGEVSLAKTVQDNFLTVFSLNKVSMGEKVVRTVAGLLIQQIFLLAQARAFGQKVILIIDEVSVVQNPALAAILAEARKFNLSVILTQQYFGQIDKPLRDAIFANVYNYYAFKVSEEDARALEGNLNIELPAALVEAAHRKGQSERELRIKLMTELHPRECLVRVLANGQMIPAIKARTVDAPVAVPLSGSAAGDLRAYKQAVLPVKFREQSPDAPPAELPSVQPQSISAPRPPAFNLSDLLAEHSSSRLKVNKKKDTP